MIRFIVGLLLCAAVSFGGETMKIATYNVENLFDLHFDRTEYAEYIPDTSWRWNRETYRRKLRNISDVLCDLDADIVALQEVESREALMDLKAEAKRRGVYYPYAAIAASKPTTVRVALLSKFPLVYAREVRVGASTAYRNILEVKLDVGGEALYLFVNHWKSKSGPESRRIVSAKALLARLKQLGDAVNVILLGDFNSDYEEHRRFLKQRRHNDTDGMTGINHVLQTLKGDRPVTRPMLAQCASCRYNLWYELEPAQRWSHRYRQYKEALDHIIISAPLIDAKGLEYVPGSFGRHMPEYLMHRGKPYRWQQSRSYPKHHTGKGYSDHLAIFAEFRW